MGVNIDFQQHLKQFPLTQHQFQTPQNFITEFNQGFQPFIRRILQMIILVQQQTQQRTRDLPFIMLLSPQLQQPLLIYINPVQNQQQHTIIQSEVPRNQGITTIQQQIRRVQQTIIRSRIQEPRRIQQPVITRLHQSIIRRQQQPVITRIQQSPVRSYLQNVQNQQFLSINDFNSNLDIENSLSFSSLQIQSSHSSEQRNQTKTHQIQQSNFIDHNHNTTNAKIKPQQLFNRPIIQQQNNKKSNQSCWSSFKNLLKNIYNKIF